MRHKTLDNRIARYMQNRFTQGVGSVVMPGAGIDFSRHRTAATVGKAWEQVCDIFRNIVNAES